MKSVMLGCAVLALDVTMEVSPLTHSPHQAVIAFGGNIGIVVSATRTEFDLKNMGVRIITDCTDGGR